MRFLHNVLGALLLFLSSVNLQLSCSTYVTQVCPAWEHTEIDNYHPFLISVQSTSNILRIRGDRVPGQRQEIPDEASAPPDVCFHII